MPRPKFDAELASRALALADFWRSDVRAAQELGISARSVQRYRAQSATDPVLAGLVAIKKSELDAESRNWAPVAMASLRSMVEKLDYLVQQADKTQIRDVAGAIKIVGDLELVRSQLQIEQSAQPEHSVASTQPSLPH